MTQEDAVVSYLSGAGVSPKSEEVEDDVQVDVEDIEAEDLSTEDPVFASSPCSSSDHPLHSPSHELRPMFPSSPRNVISASSPERNETLSPERPPIVSRFSISDILDPQFGAKLKTPASSPSSSPSPSSILDCKPQIPAPLAPSASDLSFSIYSLHFAHRQQQQQQQQQQQHHHHHQLSVSLPPSRPKCPEPIKPEPRIPHHRPIPSSPVPSGGCATGKRTAPSSTERLPGGGGEERRREQPATGSQGQGALWPAWVYCTRYSDRPSSGPRSRKLKRKDVIDDKRPRTAFTSDQLANLKREFEDNRYLTEERRQRLATELKLTESQVKIWFQNKRAKMKKSTGMRNPLALQLMAQGLYNHSTVPDGGKEEGCMDSD